ncbi:hypothetical protein IAR55_005064 [Kwoniella newhampshirensis]|uniref:Glucosamine 6-phosphate N-acetyltransferase n=1 Tax=Kwoniella newhampshirensis TaxID=1651941 RepID=A0AAW0YXA2_9TREE
MSSSTSTSTSSVPLTFRPIPPTATIPLRHLVLWPSIPLQDQLVPDYDFEPTTIHLGAFLMASGTGSSRSPKAQIGSEPQPLDATRLSRSQSDGEEPIAVLTLVHHPYPSSKLVTLPSTIAQRLPPTQIQLHKFGVHPLLQGKGVGRSILNHTIDLLRLRAASLSNDGNAEGTGRLFLHFDARASQRTFYEKCGMIVLNPELFLKFGSTGKEVGVEYVRMGNIL